ncbi:MAG: glycosyltransferase [Bacteroidota bacterium]
MIKGKDFVITGLQAWDTPIGSNCKNIAEEISKNNRVLYVNFPLDRLTVLRQKKDPSIIKRLNIIKGKQDCFEKINDNLIVFYPRIIIESTSKIPFNFLFKIINKYNNRKLAKEIQYAIDEIKLNNFYHFNDSDIFRSFYIKELLKPAMSIYYIRDYLIETPYWKRHGKYMEPLLIEKSDLIVTNSLFYADFALKYNSNSHMIGQGCDLSLFNDEDNSIKVPDDIASVNKPIIGYMGFLTEGRLDIELLIKIAEAKPEWSIVLVGPEDDGFKNSALHKLPNVHFLGSRNMSELPAYIKGFDIAINPQRLNIFTVGNYPRKIDEYLAMSKPTVATMTKAMEYFADCTYLANNSDEYITLIEKALAEDNSEKQKHRREVAKTHSWVNNVKLIYEDILNTEKKGF